jgi:hypothetical protein
LRDEVNQLKFVKKRGKLAEDCRIPITKLSNKTAIDELKTISIEDDETDTIVS